MQSITPFLWFNGNVKEAVKFYSSVFKDTKVLDQSDGPKGQISSATIRLNGQELILFDGGPYFKHSPAFSLFVTVKTQREVDSLWKKLSKGGKISRCGWLTDRFGLSWQVIPSILGDLLQDGNEAKSQKVMEAMMKMKKIDIQALKKAYAKG